MDFKVDDYCDLLVRSRLMSAAEVQTLQEWWRRNGRSLSENAEPFANWLIEQQYLTKFQAERLARGRVDRFFLNEFRLLDRISQGRMAGVFLGSRGPRDIVAIKVMPPNQTNDPQWFGRFKREADLAQRLNHPNVVRTLKTDKAEGLHYLVMEYLDGETLEELLKRRGRLPASEAVRLLQQALRGLEHIDEQGLVHRDLKPANLMLVPARQAGQPDNTLSATVKILDIGLGRDVFDEVAGEDGGNRLTMQGDVLGVPDYMAPEQAADAHNVDIRADIYSLGCILYEALTGQVPFPGGNAAMKVVRHMTEAPPALTSIVADLAPELEAIVLRMLAKQPSQRFSTPRLAAQALEGFQQRAADRRTTSAQPAPNVPVRLQPRFDDDLPGLELPSDADPGYTPAAPLLTPVSSSAAAGSSAMARGPQVHPEAAFRETVDQMQVVTRPSLPSSTAAQKAVASGPRSLVARMLASNNPLVLMLLGAGAALLLAVVLLTIALLTGLFQFGASTRPNGTSETARHIEREPFNLRVTQTVAALILDTAGPVPHNHPVVETRPPIEVAACACSAAGRGAARPTLVRCHSGNCCAA